MARLQWNGPGNVRGALPGEVIEIKDDLVRYLRGEFGADCLTKPGAVAKGDQPDEPKSEEPEKPKRSRRSEPKGEE